MEFEIEIIKGLQAVASPILTGFFKLISQLGNYIGFILAAITIFLVNKKFAVCFSITYWLGLLANWILKSIISRPRPYVKSSEILNIFPGSGTSMPSGHTLSATIIACFCVYIIFKSTNKAWIKILSSVFFTIFVGFVIVSRMYLGQHYLSDTLVALAEGILISTVGILIYKKGEKKIDNIKRK